MSCFMDGIHHSFETHQIVSLSTIFDLHILHYFKSFPR